MLGDKPKDWHWRLAMQIAAQVPPEEKDASLVLDCVWRIMQLTFAAPAGETASIAPGEGQVVPLGVGPSRPRRRATSSGSPSGLPK